MSLKSTPKIVKGLALATVMTASFTACEPGAVSEKPPIHINPNMDWQEKKKAQQESLFFEDGRSMRTPVEGTIARRINKNGTINPEWDGHKVELYTGKKADGSFATSMPALEELGFATKEDLIKRGEERYEIYCTPCHGSDGKGQGTVATIGKYPAVANITQEFYASKPDGSIYSVIKDGSLSTLMPSYAYQIEKEDRWAVTAYVRVLQEQAKKAAANAAPAADGADAVVSAEEGKKLYASKGCIACHVVGQGQAATVGPNWFGKFGNEHKVQVGGAVETITYDDAYIVESLKNPGAKISVRADGSTPFPPIMPPQNLTDAETKSIIEYMKTLK